MRRRLGREPRRPRSPLALRVRPDERVRRDHRVLRARSTPAAAAAIAEAFYEGVIAPAFSAEAASDARAKEEPPPAGDRPAGDATAREGSICAASRAGFSRRSGTSPTRRFARDGWPRSARPPTTKWKALQFAWTVVRHVKSNAIVYANASRTIGIGAGQMSRVDSAALGDPEEPRAASRRRDGLGRVLPLPRRTRCRRRGGDHRGRAARRLDPRRRGRGGRERARDDDGARGPAPLSPLELGRVPTASSLFIYDGGSDRNASASTWSRKRDP